MKAFRVFKVRIKDGCNHEFEQFCQKNSIFYKQYPEPLSTLYRVECIVGQLACNEIIISVEYMPIVGLG